jgi:ferredoxin-thioredoxin reductase catalytic chain
MSDSPSEASRKRVDKLVESYTRKSGTVTHPDPEVTDVVKLGLAHHIDTVGKPLCPCRFYPDKEEEVRHRTWICACDDMQIYKYCHCLLFTNEEGLPITEHLPEGHEGREMYGLVEDPTPDKGRPLRHKAEEREKERKERPS